MSIEQIKDILLGHVGKNNMIKAEAIAEMIGIDPGPSGVILFLGGTLYFIIANKSRVIGNLLNILTQIARPIQRHQPFSHITTVPMPVTTAKTLITISITFILNTSFES